MSTLTKYISLIIAIVLAISLVACGNRDGNVPSESQHSKSDIEFPPVEETDEEDDESNKISSEPGSLIENPGNQFIGDDMENGDTDWTSIPSTPPDIFGDDSPNMHLASIIKTVRSSEENEALEIWTDTEEEWLKRLQEYYGFNLEDFEEFAISYSPMNVKAYMVAVIKPKEGKDEDLVKAFASWTEGKTKEFESYLPDQHAIAQSAQMGMKHGYYIYCMSENALDLSEALMAQIDAKVEYETGQGESDNTELNDESGNPSIG